MSATGLEVFDKTLQTTNIWLDEVMEELGCERHAAWHALGAVLRSVRDRVKPELALHLGAQLPLLVRGIYYDQWRLSSVPEKTRSLEGFLAQVDEKLDSNRIVTPETACRAVFKVVERHVADGQARKVRETLPGEVQALWPAG